MRSPTITAAPISTPSSSPLAVSALLAVRSGWRPAVNAAAPPPKRMLGARAHDALPLALDLPCSGCCNGQNEGREEPMRVLKTIAAGFVASGLTLVPVPFDNPIAVVGPAAAQEARAAPSQLSFKLVENFLKLPPNIYMAEVVGVTLDSKGQIYVLHRGKQPILEFNPDGSFVRSIGEGLPFEGPHAVRVDPQDNLWYIDAGSNLVVKFDQQKTGANGAWPKAGAVDLGHPRDRACDSRPFQFLPADRRHLGSRRQHLCRRRLWQFADREVQQGRQSDQALGRARYPAGRVQHPA